MMSSSQQLLCKQLDVTFRNTDLLRQALTHRSMGLNNNERLEYLGDSILGFIIAEELFNRFPELKEGKLSGLRSLLVKGATLAAIAMDLNLGDTLILGLGESKSGGYRRESILAGAMEAIFGAIYLDNGLHSVKISILKLFGERLNAIDVTKTVKDPKTRLQELLQSQKQPLPVYTIKEIRTVKNQPIFEASCKVSILDDVITAQGISHRKAEQSIAERVLRLIGGGNVDGMH